MSDLQELLVLAIAALVFSAAMVYIGVSSFNKEAKQKGTTEKGYSVGSVIIGFIVAFTTAFGLLFYEFCLKGRYGR